MQNPTQPIYRFEDPEGFRFAGPGEKPSRFRYRDGDLAFFEGRRVSGPVVILPERGIGRALFIPADPERGGFLAYAWEAEKGGKFFFPCHLPIETFVDYGEAIAESIATQAIEKAQGSGEEIDWAPILPGRYVSPTLERIGREIFAEGCGEMRCDLAEETPRPDEAMRTLAKAFEDQLTAAYCRALGRK